jgi:hypothetical protein
MSGHTPWRVGDAGHTVFGPPNGTPSPETIASVRKPSNARLIAAAPDMLAALSNLVRSIERDNLNTTHGVNVAAARAAIAKATGGAA